jgi:hypothetical protein
MVYLCTGGRTVYRAEVHIYRAQPRADLFTLPSHCLGPRSHRTSPSRCRFCPSPCHVASLNELAAALHLGAQQPAACRRPAAGASRSNRLAAGGHPKPRGAWDAPRLELGALYPPSSLRAAGEATNNERRLPGPIQQQVSGAKLPLLPAGALADKRLAGFPLSSCSSRPFRRP